MREKFIILFIYELFLFCCENIKIEIIWEIHKHGIFKREKLSFSAWMKFFGWLEEIFVWFNYLGSDNLWKLTGWFCKVFWKFKKVKIEYVRAIFINFVTQKGSFPKKYVGNMMRMYGRNMMGIWWEYIIEIWSEYMIEIWWEYMI